MTYQLKVDDCLAKYNNPRAFNDKLEKIAKQPLTQRIIVTELGDLENISLLEWIKELAKSFFIQARGTTYSKTAVELALLRFVEFGAEREWIDRNNLARIQSTALRAGVIERSASFKLGKDLAGKSKKGATHQMIDLLVRETMPKRIRTAHNREAGQKILQEFCKTNQHKLKTLPKNLQKSLGVERILCQTFPTVSVKSAAFNSKVIHADTAFPLATVARRTASSAENKIELEKRKLLENLCAELRAHLPQQVEGDDIIDAYFLALTGQKKRSDHLVDEWIETKIFNMIFSEYHPKQYKELKKTLESLGRTIGLQNAFILMARSYQMAVALKDHALAHESGRQIVEHQFKIQLAKLIARRPEYLDLRLNEMKLNAKLVRKSFTDHLQEAKEHAARWQLLSALALRTLLLAPVVAAGLAIYQYGRASRTPPPPPVIPINVTHATSPETVLQNFNETKIFPYNFTIDEVLNSSIEEQNRTSSNDTIVHADANTNNSNHTLIRANAANKTSVGLEVSEPDYPESENLEFDTGFDHTAFEIPSSPPPKMENYTFNQSKKITPITEEVLKNKEQETASQKSGAPTPPEQQQTHRMRHENFSTDQPESSSYFGYVVSAAVVICAIATAILRMLPRKSERSGGSSAGSSYENKSFSSVQPTYQANSIVSSSGHVGPMITYTSEMSGEEAIVSTPPVFDASKKTAPSISVTPAAVTPTRPRSRSSPDSPAAVKSLLTTSSTPSPHLSSSMIWERKKLLNQPISTWPTPAGKSKTENSPQPTTTADPHVTTITTTSMHTPEKTALSSSTIQKTLNTTQVAASHSPQETPPSPKKRSISHSTPSQVATPHFTSSHTSSFEIKMHLTALALKDLMIEYCTGEGVRISLKSVIEIIKKSQALKVQIKESELEFKNESKKIDEHTINLLMTIVTILKKGLTFSQEVKLGLVSEFAKEKNIVNQWKESMLDCNTDEDVLGNKGVLSLIEKQNERLDQIISSSIQSSSSMASKDDFEYTQNLYLQLEMYIEFILNESLKIMSDLDAIDKHKIDDYVKYKQKLDSEKKQEIVDYGRKYDKVTVLISKLEETQKFLKDYEKRMSTLKKLLEKNSQ
jgi:hypothetical protein